jgi:two-component system, chemotaxis family, protein-glutamate methylesterase/glutaminase
MIRALVIDDSAYNRVTISRMLEASGEISVIATATDGEDGIKQTLRQKPDVITLDLEMPGIDGFAFLRWLMINRPTPVIVVSSRASDRSVFKALELGAADFVAKPGGRISPRLSEIQTDLINKVRAATEISLENLVARSRETDPPVRPSLQPAAEAPAVDLVVIGASTGGPPAIQRLLQELPLLKVPIIVAQHMPANFTRLFSERIDKLTPFRVKEPHDGEVLAPGTAYVAPGGMQTEVSESSRVLTARVRPSVAGDLYAPSVDRLFRSASSACGKRLIAILLTGMGDDGALAMREVKGRGGHTIAEAASSAIIFGMPAEAIRTGSVDEVLPLPEMPRAITRLCGC